MISQLALPRVAAPGSGDGARGALQLPRVGSIMRSREQQGEKSMVDSVYKIIELVGTSTESWEKAAGAAASHGPQDLRDLRLDAGVQLDMHVLKCHVDELRV